MNLLVFVLCWCIVPKRCYSTLKGTTFGTIGRRIKIAIMCKTVSGFIAQFLQTPFAIKAAIPLRSLPLCDFGMHLRLLACCLKKRKVHKLAMRPPRLSAALLPPHPCWPKWCKRHQSRRIAHPPRALLRPGAAFPPNNEQLEAIEGLKELMLQMHVLAVPD